MANGMAGAIIYEIQKAGFEIAAIQTVNKFSKKFLCIKNNISYRLKKVSFTKPNAEEFLEVYKGVLHEYPVNIC